MLIIFHSTALENVPCTPDIPNIPAIGIAAGVIFFLAFLFAIITMCLLVGCFIKRKQKVGVITTELTDRLNNYNEVNNNFLEAMYVIHYLELFMRQTTIVTSGISMVCVFAVNLIFIVIL